MASITKDSKGWRVHIVNAHGVRKHIRVPNVDKATANQVAHHCDVLASVKAAGGAIPRQTALWLDSISDRLRTKLVNADLADPRESKVGQIQSVSLSKFIDSFIADGRTLDGRNASDSTKKKWTTAKNHLVKYFGRGIKVGEITPQQAQAFRQYLESQRIQRTGERMRENSKRKVIATTKVMFTKAVQLELIKRNPFAHEVSSSLAVRDRDFYVTPQMTDKLLAAAPDAQWRLIIALWRLAGLRKMEIHSICWGDVLFAQGRFRVKASKTAHIEGREVRYVPLAPVKKFVEDAMQAALPEGKTSLPAGDSVVTRFSPTNVNLHKPFLKIIEKAGLVPWPKLIQNLRASCETDWLDLGIPAHAVAKWIGHTVQVQNDSYAQVDDHHFERFNDIYTEKVARIVAQHSDVSGGITMRCETTEDENLLVRPLSAQKKHSQKTVLNAPERSRTSTSITDT